MYSAGCPNSRRLYYLIDNPSRPLGGEADPVVEAWSLSHASATPLSPGRHAHQAPALTGLSKRYSTLLRAANIPTVSVSVEVTPLRAVYLADKSSPQPLSLQMLIP